MKDKIKAVSFLAPAFFVGLFAFASIAAAATTIGTDVITDGSVVTGNTLAGLGGDPVPGALLVGNATYAGGGTSPGANGYPPVQLEWNITDPTALDIIETGVNYNPTGDMPTDFGAHAFGSSYGGTHNFGNVNAVNLTTSATGSGTISGLNNLWLYGFVSDTRIVPLWSYMYFSKPDIAGTASVTAFDYIYGSDLSGVGATNLYYSWFDSRGVRRVKEDSTFNSVGQAIEALYNPLFTKYTPGATDYERIVLGQWNSNIAEIGTQAGGTGTLRPLRLIGSQLYVPGHLNSSTTNSDLDGTIAISSATSASHTFATAFNSTPVCTLTPTSDATSVGIPWVTATMSAVTAHIPTSGTITFNYHCVGNPN